MEEKQGDQTRSETIPRFTAKEKFDSNATEELPPKRSKYVLLILNLYSAIIVFIKELFTVQSAVACLLAIFATLYTYFQTVSITQHLW